MSKKDWQLLKAYQATGLTPEEVERVKRKRVPESPFYEGDGYADGNLVYDIAMCQECGHVFEYGETDWGSKFCLDCGQALLWEDA